MNLLALTASEAAAWGGLIAAISAAIVAVIAALKGQQANTKADANSVAASENRESIRRVADREHQRALATPAPPTEAEPARPPATFRPPLP